MISRTDERTLCQFLNDLEGCGAIPERDLNDLIHPGRLRKPIEIKIYQRFGVIDERTLWWILSDLRIVVIGRRLIPERYFLDLAQPCTAWEAEKTYISLCSHDCQRLLNEPCDQFLEDLQGCGSIPERYLNNLQWPWEAREAEETYGNKGIPNIPNDWWTDAVIKFLDDLEWCGCGSTSETFYGLGGWENLWNQMDSHDFKDWWANLVSILERSWRVWSDSRTRLERPYTSWEAEKTYRNKDIPTIWSDWWTNIVMDSKRSWRA